MKYREFQVPISFPDRRGHYSCPTFLPETPELDIFDSRAKFFYRTWPLFYAISAVTLFLICWL